MFKTVPVAILAFVASGSVLFASEGVRDVPAQVSFVEDETGDVARIGAAKTLRTFSQKIPTIACFLHNGIDVEENRRLLVGARDKFQLKLSALRDGNAEMGIVGGETRRKTIARIDDVASLWSEIDTAVTTLIESPEDQSAAGLVKGRNVDFFDVTHILVTEVSGQYSNPAIIDKAQALRLNIVSRTATMTQKIAKNVCMSVTYPDAPEFKERLQEAANIYGASLSALRNGMPEMGLQAAPTPEIDAELGTLLASWSDLKPGVDAVLAGQSMAPDAKSELFARIVVDMNKIEALMFAYKDYAKYDY